MHDATERQKAVAWISVAATATWVLLGLTLSALITRRLVGPVRSLITGIKTVEQGDLTVQLPIQSSDEVGKLTQSFNFFIRELRAKDDINALSANTSTRVCWTALFSSRALTKQASGAK